MTIKYTKTVFVFTVDPGTENEFLALATSADEVQELRDSFNNASVQVARYVLAGTGVVHNDGSYYVEDSRSHQAPQCDEEA